MNINTHKLVISMATNGHDTSMANVMAVTGCTQQELKEALPLIWNHARNCPPAECLKLCALRKEIRKA